MERRKAEIREQFGTLKQECQATVELLSKLLQMCSHQIDIIDKLDSKSFRQYSKFFLAVLQFQSLSKQKVLEWNFDLEEFLTEKCIPDPENFQTCDLSESDKTVVLLNKEFSLCLNSFEDVQSSLKPTQESTSEQDKILRIIGEKVIFTDKKDVNLSSSSTKWTSDTEDFYTVPDNLNDSLATSDFHSTTSATDKVESENKQVHSVGVNDVKAPVIHALGSSSNVTEILKSLPVMTTEEKCLKTLIEDFNYNSLFAANDTETKPLCTISKGADSITAQKSSENSLASQKNSSKDFGNIDDQQSLQIVGNVTKFEVDQIQEKSEDKPIRRIGSKLPPRIGDVCMIGHVESPREFYIQVADEDIGFIDDLPAELSALYGDTPFVHTSKADSMREYGNFYAAYISDLWYRAEVIDWMMNEKLDVMIQLVDYGHKYKVNYEGLYPLTEDLCKLPKVAHLCHLAYLYPPNSTKENRLTDWPEEVLEGILEVFGDLNESSFKLVHVYYCKERGSYEVDLVHDEEPDTAEKTIGDILIEKGLAVQIFDNDADVLRNSVIINQIRKAQGRV